jgi:AraC-like DNA-binding protein
MSTLPDDFATLRLSTDALPEHDRLPVLREVWGRMFGLDIESRTDAPVRWAVTARMLPDLVVSTHEGSLVCCRRTRELATDGNDDVCLVRSPLVDSVVTYRGRELEPAPGATLVFSLADPFACAGRAVRARSTSVNAVSVPRRVLAAMVPRLEDSFGEVLPTDSEALRLLGSYVGLLAQDQALATLELRRLAVTHVHDLLALALGASRDAAEIAKRRGLRAARVNAIKADIRASLGELDLTLIALAARHRVTPRYIQALFEDEGTTFSQFLLGERLERVYRMLRHPLHLGRSISTIAYDAGFGDLSHFNRAFRRRYGATPSDVRAAAEL